MTLTMDVDHINPAELDPGIRDVVVALRAGGIETFESCEGGPGHAFFEPTVKFAGEQGEGYRAVAVARDHGLPVLHLRRAWYMLDGELTGPWWEMTFRTTDPDQPDYHLPTC